jgi:hypothetical protein
MGPVTLSTQMTPEECVDRLRGSIHQQKITSLSSRRPSDERGHPKPVRGEIDGHSFRIQRHHRFSRGDDEVGPICHGAFRPREGGTEILVRFELHPLLKWSYLALVAYIVLSGYSVMIGLLLGTRPWRQYWPDMLSHGLLVVMVLSFMYFSIPRREHEYIVDFLKWKFDAKEIR